MPLLRGGWRHGRSRPDLCWARLCFGRLNPGRWAIPCATDIAFSLLTSRLIFGAKHPAIPFLLLLAIADDALGLAVLAVFYPTAMLRPVEFAVLLGIALGIAVLLRRLAVASFWPYIIGAGAVSWLAFFRGGLHPALALVPIVPFVPHARSDHGLFSRSAGGDLLSAFEHWWQTPVQLILFVFGLVNAGVPISSTGPGTWIVLGSILIGKPVGILSLVALGGALGLHRPAGVTWRDLWSWASQPLSALRSRSSSRPRPFPKGHYSIRSRWVRF